MGLADQLEVGFPAIPSHQLDQAFRLVRRVGPARVLVLLSVPPVEDSIHDEPPGFEWVGLIYRIGSFPELPRMGMALGLNPSRVSYSSLSR